MEITKDTKVAEILEEYGDLPEVMGAFGVQQMGRYALQNPAARTVTVEKAARVHRLSLGALLDALNRAAATKRAAEATKSG